MFKKQNWFSLAVFVIGLFGSIATSLHAQQPVPNNPAASSQAQPVSGTITANQGTPAAVANTWPVSAQPYPLGATPSIGGSGVVGNATATATLNGLSNVSTYLAGFTITADGATAAACVTATVTGITGGGTFNYLYCAPAGVTSESPIMTVTFNPPLKSSATNTNIVVSLPALGAGNTGAAVNAWGYLQ